MSTVTSEIALLLKRQTNLFALNVLECVPIIKDSSKCFICERFNICMYIQRLNYYGKLKDFHAIRKYEEQTGESQAALYSQLFAVMDSGNRIGVCEFCRMCDCGAGLEVVGWPKPDDRPSPGLLCRECYLSDCVNKVELQIRTLDARELCISGIKAEIMSAAPIQLEALPEMEIISLTPEPKAEIVARLEPTQPEEQRTSLISADVYANAMSMLPLLTAANFKKPNMDRHTYGMMKRYGLPVAQEIQDFTNAAKNDRPPEKDDDASPTNACDSAATTTTMTSLSKIVPLHSGGKRDVSKKFQSIRVGRVNLVKSNNSHPPAPPSDDSGAKQLACKQLKRLRRRVGSIGQKLFNIEVSHKKEAFSDFDDVVRGLYQKLLPLKKMADALKASDSDFEFSRQRRHFNQYFVTLQNQLKHLDETFMSNTLFT